MRRTENLGLSLYDSTDKMNITGAENSLNHNMELIDEAIHNIQGVGNGGGGSATVDLSPYRTSEEQDVIDEEIKSMIGLPSSVKSAILECFSRVAWTDADGLKAYQKLESALDSVNEPSGGGSGESGGETLPSYKVTYNLANCTVDNRVSIIAEGKNYVSNIVPNDGYELLSCSVTIGDVTTSVDDGAVIVNDVSNNITINAVCSVLDVELSIDKFISGKISGNKKSSTVMEIWKASRASWVGLDYIIKANQQYMTTINLVDSELTVSPIQYGVQRFDTTSYEEAADGEAPVSSDSGWKTGLTYTFSDVSDRYVMFTFNAKLETVKSNIKSIKIEKVV